ncbi:MAG: DUF1836 domain-containing protein [Acutalibacteraceae bacterium]|nr:DUF1836 domain-containing protein [Acutalibacteraceae bacterium]
MNKNDIEITVSTMEDIANTSFPSWDELPEFELYMDQVIAIVNRYMGNMADLMHDEKIITQAMINNYVKNKLIPPPVKKRYSKIHIAALLIICSCKQSMNISSIMAFLDFESNEKMRVCYQNFLINRNSVIQEMKTLIDTKVKTIDKDQSAELIRMAQKSALRSGYYKIFAQKMLDLFNEDDIKEETEHKKK